MSSKAGPIVTVFVYDANEQLIAEYTTGTPSGSGVQYVTSDQLGSTRLITAVSGVVEARYDYLPFGEELWTGDGARTGAMKYTPVVPDPWRQKFSAKERDTETGLDYFLSRYYSAAQGRFASADEFSGGPVELGSFADSASANPTFYSDLSNPQSLNKYQYTYDNPLSKVDPDGHCPTCPSVAGVMLGIQSYFNPAKALDVVQTGVSTVGVVPAFGEIADLANAAISALRGNYVEAGIDLAGALGPAGSAAAVAFRGRKIARIASKVEDVADDAAGAVAKIPFEQRVPIPSSAKKQAVYDANRAKNGGELKCDICGVRMIPSKKSMSGVTPKRTEATVDHIKARSKGGTNDPTNLQGACRKCNREKGDNE